MGTSKRLGIGGTVRFTAGVASGDVGELLGGADSAEGRSGGGKTSCSVHMSRKLQTSSPELSWLGKSGAFVFGGDRIKDEGGDGVWEGEDCDWLVGGLAGSEEEALLGVIAGWCHITGSVKGILWAA